MVRSILVIVAAVLTAIGGGAYVLDTLRGVSQPNRVTWFLWACAPLIAFVAELGSHVGVPALLTFMVGFMPALVFGASFVNRRAFWEITGLDWVCGAASVLALVLWRVTSNPDLAISFSIVADALAAVPTVIKSYRDPESETWLTYLMYLVAAGLTLLAVTNWTLAEWGFPVYILMLCSLLFCLTIRPTMVRCLARLH